jgi:hypothetical protein
MAEITIPELKLPDIRLPEGLREMTRDDIVHAAKDVHLPKDIHLPKQVTDRIPGRRRANPIVPIAAVLAVGAAIAAAWYLITSPVTGPRIRVAVSDLRSRVTGGHTDLVRYDDDQDLGSLLPVQADDTPSPAGNGTTPPGLATDPHEMPERVGTTA